MNYFKIIRKEISKLNMCKELSEFMNYTILIEFQYIDFDKIIVKNIPAILEDHDICLLIVFSIPNNFDFKFIKELGIKKKVFNKLTYHFIKRYLLVSIIDSDIYLTEKEINELTKILKDSEKKLNKVFVDNTEILDEGEFNNIFVYIN